MIEKVPQTWQIADLGKIAKEFISGGTPSTKEAKFWDGDIPWTTSAPISDTDIFIDCGQRFITLEGLENSASHLVPKGNLLVGTRVGVGKAVVNLIDIAISQDLTGIVLNSSSTPAFIAYQFKTQRATSFFFGRKRGTTIKGIARLDLHALPLSIPPLPEQQAIVQALRAVQEAREARRQEAALERERKAALMDYLFTQGTHGEPRQQTEIGKIPQSWRAVKLGAHCHKPQYGFTASSTDEPIGPQFLRITDIQEDKVDWGSVPYCVCKDKLKQSYILESGDIVIARIGATTGKTYLVKECPEAIYASYLIRIRAKKDLLPEILFFFSQTENYWNQINQKKGGRLKGGVNIPILQNLIMPLPPISEQKVIAEVLDLCDAKVTALEKEAELLEELFRAMLEELMAGRLSALPLVEAEVTA